MPVCTKFEAHKIKRELACSGRMCKFLRCCKNEFGEPDEDSEPDVVCECLCVYHESSLAQTMTTEVGSQTVSKKLPMLLTLYENVELIAMNDFVVLNGKKMKVVGVDNVGEWDIIADVSLEVCE